MPSALELQQREFIGQFENWLQSYLDASKKDNFFAPVLLQSQSYSLLSGGKRFRPFLAFLVFKLFSENFIKIRSLCLALEMVHTYSLIHDDLPCMDNDDLRRGKPTNHKVFSEDISLLAGDGLLSDVFFLLAADKNLTAPVKIELVQLLSEKIGSRGMVSGQVFDMQAAAGITSEELRRIHQLKTANLIQAAAMGAALTAEASEAELHNISEFSFHLGMAFQIKDDILDGNDKEQDFKSYVSFLGAEKTQELLREHSDAAVDAIKSFSKSDLLLDLVNFNLQRTS